MAFCCHNFCDLYLVVADVKGSLSANFVLKKQFWAKLVDAMRYSSISEAFSLEHIKAFAWNTSVWSIERYVLIDWNSTIPQYFHLHLSPKDLFASYSHIEDAWDTPLWVEKITQVWGNLYPSQSEVDDLNPGFGLRSSVWCSVLQVSILFAAIPVLFNFQIPFNGNYHLDILKTFF